jgi:hypothetical protein
MNRLRVCIAWLSAFLMLTANLGLEGCGAKEAPASTQAAQQQDASASTQATQQANPSGPPSANATNNAPAQLPEINLSADGLDELLAPIALYPDPVLAIMLQASVDPQEVMDGGNWLLLDPNKDLKGAALDEASAKAGFTPVMQALLHYPSVMDLMCTQWDWTKQLGAAYEANPKAVLDSVQRLRAQAVDTGALKTSREMKVDVTQSNGQQVVELKPADPKVVYIPQYNPEQVFQTTTTTTTRPDGTVTSTTTTTGPAPATSSSNTTTVVKEKEGVSTGTAVMIGLLAFGAGIAVGTAINRNNYYYPAWGYGGVWYGPRPYYPPPYRPVYYPGWGPGYHYYRPPYYRNTIVINNNYYNRFNNNNNLHPNYKPRPVPYNSNPNSNYSRNMGSQPGARQGASYRPNNPNNPNVSTRPATGNVPNRAGGANAGNNVAPAQRPATGNTAANNPNNWRGQTTYQGNKGNDRPPSATTSPNVPARNPSGDRGFPQNGGARPSTGNVQQNGPNTGNNQYAGQRPDTSRNTQLAGTPSPGNQAANRPTPGNQPAARPATGTQQPAVRPAHQPQNRPQPSGGGAFDGASNPKSDRAASKRGQTSMGGQGARQTQPRPGASAKPR